MSHTAAAPGRENAAEGSALRLSWVQPTGLVGLSFANFLLRILTLGIYNFWGTTETRRRVWSAVRLDGEPLAYTGTGRELFLGFLIVSLALLVPMTILSLVVFAIFGGTPAITTGYQASVMLFFLFLTGVAIYRARRYRLSRTSWRGIRGGLDGDSWGFGWSYFWTLIAPFVAAVALSGSLFYSLAGGKGSLLDSSASEGNYAMATGIVILALLPLLAASWIFPWRSTRLQHWLTNDMKFGNRSFRFDAPAGPLYKPFAVFWLGVALLVVGTLVIFAIVSAGAGIAMGAPGAEGNTGDPMLLLAVLVGLTYIVLPVAYLVFLLLSAFYRARQFNHFARHTHFEGAKLVSTVSGRGLVWNTIGNFFLRVLGMLFGALILAILFMAYSAIMGTESLESLAKPPGGAAAPDVAVQVLIFASIIILAASASLFGPIIQARTTRYLVQNLSIVGTVPLADIAQGAEDGLKRGEGLAQAFDVDAF